MTNQATRSFRFRHARWTVSTVCCALAIFSSGVAQGGVWTSNGPRGGFVRSLAADPTNPSTVYAGTSSGGVFKSTNAGSSWTFASTGIQDQGDYLITGLAVDAGTPSRVYATAQSGPDGGIFRSTNGGTSWTFDPVGWTSAIVTVPGTPTTLYATGQNVLKSVDAGVTWTPVLDGTSFGSSYGIAVDPVTPSTVYVGLNGWISKTTNAGATWAPIAPGLPGDQDLVMAIAIDPAMPANVYAGTENGVFKSVDAGLHFSPILPGLSTQALVIDPANPNVVYAGGYSADDAHVYKSVDGGGTWAPSPVEEYTNALALLNGTTLLAGTIDTGMFKTIDAAATWAPSNTGLIATGVLSLATNPAQPGKAYTGTGSRVVRTTDGGDSWTNTDSFLTQGIASMVADPSAPGTVYAGDFALQGVWKTIDDGDSWFTISNSNQSPLNAHALRLAPTDPTTVYAGGALVGVVTSPNGGTSWTPLNNGLFPSVVALVIDPVDPTTMYAGTDPFNGGFQGVFKTTNSGASWSTVNNGLPVNAINVAVEDLAMDLADPSILYAAVEHTGIFKSTNGGASWTPMNAGLGSLEVTAVAVDAVVANRVYASTRDEGVFRTDDAGATWTALNDGLVTPSVTALAVEPGRVYAGTGANGTFVMEVDVTTTTSTSTSSSTTSTTLAPGLLGRGITVRDPNLADPSKRKIVAAAREANADETLNPFALVESGGSVTITTFGATPTTQMYRLSPPLWTLLGTTGAKYSDKTGMFGPVKTVVVKKSASGTFQLKVTIVGKLGPGPQPHVTVVPPNPGVGAKMVFQVNGDATYCVGYGGAAGGQVTNNGPLSFRVSNPTAAVCP